MLVVILKRNEILKFKYFDRKSIGFYSYIIGNKILFRRIEIINQGI